MLVLIDLDKTLIDESYQLTDIGIRSAIQAAQNKGHSIGLSSDSSFTTLGIWHERLGMNGPILAERGAAYKIPRQEPTPTGSADEKVFRTLRDFFEDHLIKLGYDVILCDPSITVCENDPSDFTTKSILVNAFRRWSFHAVFLGNDNALRTAREIFDEACDEYSWSPSDFDLDFNFEYCLLIIHDKLTNKTFGMKRLMEDVQVEKAVIIGDDLNDYTGLPSVSHWAVGNASDDYKIKCDRIAKATYTSGVIELINSLDLD